MYLYFLSSVSVSVKQINIIIIKKRHFAITSKYFIFAVSKT